VPAQLVHAGPVDLGQVQADELRVRVSRGVLWLASARAVPSRRWLGGVISPQRDRGLSRALLGRVRAGGPTQTVLLCTDGLARYARQAVRLFREPVRSGCRGRPRLGLPEGGLIAQVIKQYAQRRVVGVVRRVVVGTRAAVHATVVTTQDRMTAVSNTASAERLNATFRARLAPLIRRTRVAVRHAATLEAGLWVVGTCSNFCWPHRSLRRRRGPADPPGGRWVERTPAQAAGLTDHRWSLHDLLTYPVPESVPKRRGRRPKWVVEAARAA
jgi:hypothetical protein